MGGSSKQPRTFFVAVNPAILKIVSVRAAMDGSGWSKRYRRQNESDDDFVERMQGLDSIVLEASNYDDTKHFGPTLTAGSGDFDFEVTIPWADVRAVVAAPAGKMPLGFYSASNHETTSGQKGK